MKSNLLSLLLCVIFISLSSCDSSNPSNSQSNDEISESWSKYYYVDEQGYARLIVPSNDGKFIAHGFKRESSLAKTKYYFMKVDNNGDVLWDFSFHDTTKSIEVEDIISNGSNGYVVLVNVDNYGYYLFEMNEDGSIVWEKYFGGEISARSVMRTARGTYLVGTKVGEYSYDLVITEFDNTGNQINENTYDDVGAKKLILTSDNSCLMVGSTVSYGSSPTKVVLMKIDTSGVVEWKKEFGGVGTDYFNNVLKCSDGYLLTGTIDSSEANGYDAWIVKTDLDGDILWSKAIGNADSEYFYNSIQLDNGNYLITGRTRSYGEGSYDAWLVEVDNSGNIVSTQTYGGEYLDSGESIAKNNSSILWLGESQLTETYSSTIWIKKLVY